MKCGNNEDNSTINLRMLFDVLVLRLSSTNFTWSIFEYLDPYIFNFLLSIFVYTKVK